MAQTVNRRLAELEKTVKAQGERLQAQTERIEQLEREADELLACQVFATVEQWTVQ